MNYSIYFISYYIIGFIICMSHLIYETLTDKTDDAIEEIELFFFWPIVIPVALFVWFQKKFKI